MATQNIKIEFSIKSILLVITTLAAIWFALKIQTILIIVFVAFILTSAIEPLALYLKKFRIPTVLSMAITYILALSIFIIVGFMVVPPLITQVNAFIKHLPDVSAQAIEALGGWGVDEPQVHSYMNTVSDYVSTKAEGISGGLLQVGMGVVTTILTIITIVVASFYILLEKQRLYEGLELMVGRTRYRTLEPIIKKIEKRLGDWVRGQLLLGLIIGIATWIGLTILQIPYALPLAIIAGILELVPLVGPIIASIPAILVALTISPAMAIITTLLYIVIQQLESNLVVPKVMEKAVGLNPFFVLVAILAGGAVMGIIGALLAIPVAVVLAVILEEVGGFSEKTK